MIIWRPFHIDVSKMRVEGAPLVVIAVQRSVQGLYRAPPRPHTIISFPVHTAVRGPLGAPFVLMAAQLSVTGSYLAPPEDVPQTIISLPVQTEPFPAMGAPLVFTAVQLSVAGLYRAPLFNGMLL